MTHLSCETILKACWWSCEERRAFVVSNNEEICNLQVSNVHSALLLYLVLMS